MLPLNVNRRVMELSKKETTKAGIARSLLVEGYSVSEISKAVPMAYSQVHSIQKQRLENANPGRERGRGAGLSVSRGSATQATFTRASGSTAKAPRASQPSSFQAAQKAQGFKVGKLRTPGAPSDIEVGECANCGFDLVVRRAPIAGQTKLILVHVNILPDEYIHTVQFCQAVPKKLLA
jgi:hypothetical protein